MLFCSFDYKSLLYKRNIKIASLLFLVLIAYGLIDGKIIKGNLIFIVLLLFSQQFEKFNFTGFLSSLQWYFWTVSAYGLAQRYFGYNSFELAWIKSGLGVVGEAGYYVTDDIRPFSVFAGVPEFGFFAVIFSYFFLYKKKYAFFTFALVLLLVIGSRGVILGALVSHIIIYLFKNKHTIGLLVSLLASLLLYLIFPLIASFNLLIAHESSTRLLVYGTLNARYLSAIEYYNSFKIQNLILPLNLEQRIKDLGLVIDNTYLRLLNDLSVVGIVIMLILFISTVNSTRRLFFSSFFICYGFYAELNYGLYFMYNFMFVYLSSEDPFPLSSDKGKITGH